MMMMIYLISYSYILISTANIQNIFRFTFILVVKKEKCCNNNKKVALLFAGQEYFLTFA